MSTPTPLPTTLADLPGWRRSQRQAVATVAIGGVLILALLGQAVQSVGDLAEEVDRANQLSLAFADTLRLFGRLELAATVEDRLDAPAVVDVTELLGRQLQLVERRGQLDTTGPTLVADSRGVVERFDAFMALQAASPLAVEEGRSLLAEAERFAKGAADRNETEKREALLAHTSAVRTTAVRTGLFAALTVLSALGVVFTARRRFTAAYEHAYRVALAHADGLARANEELRAANETKQRFISVVSHELRTPLTVIKGFAETLLLHDDRLSGERRKELAASIQRQAERQERMVSDLLEVARGTVTAPEPVAETFPVGRIVAQVVADLPPEPGRHVLLEGDEGTHAFADPAQAEQIVENLLTNARKYGGPTTTVRWGVEDGVAVVRVEDDGGGVPEHFRSRLFEAFSQADTGDTRAGSGVGLGLSISRTLALANGGDLHHEPRPVGGAVFVLRLPADPDADVPAGPERRHGPGRREYDQPTGQFAAGLPQP